MIQTTVAGNTLLTWVPRQSPGGKLADADYEEYPEQRYLSVQSEPLASEAGLPHRRPAHQIQVLYGIPMHLQSQSLLETGGGAIQEPISSALERQSDLVDIPQNKSSNAESSEKRARPLFLLRIALSENSKHIVGENGVRRFEEFKSYSDGWDYGRGCALSAGSLRLLNSFLKDLPELVSYEPSLFLTHQGNLQLGWEDLTGDVVELEFFRDRIEYYVEALNEEGSAGVQDRSQLVQMIRSTLE